MANGFRRAAMAGMLLFAGTAFGAEPATAPTDAGAAINPDAVALTGKTASSFKAQDLAGTIHSLADAKGHVLVLDFWATYCVPCREELPHLTALAAKHASDGLLIWTVNEAETNKQVQAFVDENKVTLPVLLDADSAVGNAFKVDPLPETVVIGKDGKILNIFVGLTVAGISRLDEAVQAALADGVAAVPSTAPADAGIELTPQVRDQLLVVAKAYLNLKSLSLTGTLDGNANIGGKQVARSSPLLASYSAPLTFRHEVRGDCIASLSKEKAYLFVPSENSYSADDPPATRGRLGDLPGELPVLLRLQDPSLALAISNDPMADLLDSATSVKAVPNTIIEGKAFPSLQFAYPVRDVTIAFDPATHLIRHWQSDESRGLTARGAEVKTATTSVDYTTTTADAAISPDQLAFVPPPTSQEQQGSDMAAAALEGKQAPTFKLETLAGGAQVSNKSLKNTVYVLDFFATWCGPCRASLPGLDQIYKKNKAAGLVVYAVDQGEAAAAIDPFIHDTRLSIPILLDPEMKAGGAFGAEGIPETVVVNRNGIVRKVFIGSGNEEGIAAAVDAALAGTP